MRNKVIYNIKNPDLLLSQFISLTKKYKYSCLLNSNPSSENQPKEYNTFSIMLALDKIDLIESNHNSFKKLKKFHIHKKDWMFGYLSYDLKNENTNLYSKNIDNISHSNLSFFVPKYLFILKGDNLTIESYESKENLVEFYKKINNIKPVKSEKVKYDLLQRESKDIYLKKINMIKKHIQNGDIYEMNYCQEFFNENANCSPQDIYKRLNLLAQSPFSCFLNLRNINIMCASPERFLKKTGSNILSQPIKGTSRRSEDPKEDIFLFEKLSKSVKDKTENVMIVDLVRNDLSMTAEKSSVKVDDLCSVYPFNQVYQMISTVSSKIDLTKYTFSDVLETNFPMGSMTGAPKHSAMRIIEKFEATKRGLFSGSVGYIDPDGDFDFNVIIRSIIYDSAKKYLSVSVGGAITNKSIDIEEYQECLTKATLMFNALNFNFDD
tara:strand:+ start:603 stop:1910 length:1308 start_codon:yes stop_codon:yes gene_type:complete